MNEDKEQSIRDILAAELQIKPQHNYAGFHRRMLAATIDSLLLTILAAPLIDMMLASIYGPMPQNVSSLPALIQAQSDPQLMKKLFDETLIKSGYLARWFANLFWQFVMLGAFTGLCWHYWSATPGKMMLRMKIVDADSFQPISNAQIVTRLLGYIGSSVFLFMGFIWISSSKRRQGWHDSWANTVVIIVPRKGEQLSPPP
jgi:uncharacterized RDD family membrane protein YckC